MPTSERIASSRREGLTRVSSFACDTRERLIAMPDIPVIDTVFTKQYTSVYTSSHNGYSNETRKGNNLHNNAYMSAPDSLRGAPDIPVRCRLCGEYRKETHACGEMKKKIDTDFAMLMLKRACVATIVLLYGVATIVTGVALTTAVALTLMIVTFPLIRRAYNSSRFVKGKQEEPASSCVNAMNEATEHVSNAANKVGWNGVVKIKYDNSVDGQSALAYVEPTGRDEFTVYVSENFLTELTPQEQESILAHEIGHMTNRRPRQVCVLLRGISVAAGIATGAIIFAEGGTLMAATAVMAAVAIPLYLVGQSVSRKEERRADTIAYRYYPDVYPQALKKVLGTGYRPGQNLPFQLADILEEHPSYRNRMENIRKANL